MSQPPPRVTRAQSRMIVIGILRDSVLNDNKALTLSDICARFGRSASYTSLLLMELEAQGDAERTHGRKPVWWTTTEQGNRTWKEGGDA